MAHNEDIDRIRLAPTIERILKFKVLDYDGVIRYARETPMEQIWPSGDPVGRDRETLVEFISKDQFESGINGIP
jgi:hypothetical protein